MKPCRDLGVSRQQSQRGGLEAGAHLCVRGLARGSMEETGRGQVAEGLSLRSRGGLPAGPSHEA